MKLVTVPWAVMMIVIVLICVMAWSGVQISIADAMYVLGVSFCATHVLIFSYSLGKAHGKKARSALHDEKGAVIEPLPSEMIKNSRAVRSTDKKEYWNPLEGF